jgi:hypothetical protein
VGGGLSGVSDGVCVSDDVALTDALQPRSVRGARGRQMKQAGASGASAWGLGARL